LLKKESELGRKPHPLTALVRKVWATGDPERSAQEIMDEVNRLRPKGARPIHLRAVQSKLKPLRLDVTGFARGPWIPWADGSTPRLLVLNLVSNRLFGHSLRTDEAEWAILLEEGLGNLDAFVQLVIVREYAISDRISQIDGEATAYRQNLDDLLAHRPWEDDGQLWVAATSHVVNAPTVFSLNYRTSADSNIKDVELAASRNLRDWVESSLGIYKSGRTLPTPSILTWRDFVRGSYEKRSPEEIAAEWAGVSPNTGQLE
jgi:hypothetical protein